MIILNSYQNLRKDSDEFECVRYSWFVELREQLKFNDISCEEIVLNVKDYFLYFYKNIPLAI